MNQSKCLRICDEKTCHEYKWPNQHFMNALFECDMHTRVSSFGCVAISLPEKHNGKEMIDYRLTITTKMRLNSFTLFSSYV